MLRVHDPRRSHAHPIDLRPGNHTIHGVTLSSPLYTVDETTGAASFVAALSSPIVDRAQGWGIDFNPLADFRGAASLRFVGTGGGNYAINANTPSTPALRCRRVPCPSRAATR